MTARTWVRNRVRLVEALAKPRRADRSWSQYGEDEVLARELKDLVRDGFYVDVGANHPMHLSNTYRLYCMGMRGVCVEPEPELAGLIERFRPGDRVLAAAIGREPAVLKFHELAYTALSTFSPAELQRRTDAGNKVVRTSHRPVLPLSVVVRDCAPEGRTVFALLSVDVEGMDEEVLRSGDWKRDRPRLVIVESNDDQTAQSTKSFLDSVGYEQVGTFGCNGLFKSR
jgi:FkbM family methyltransferase